MSKIQVPTSGQPRIGWLGSHQCDDVLDSIYLALWDFKNHQDQAKVTKLRALCKK